MTEQQMQGRVCECEEVNVDRVALVCENMPPVQTLYSLADFFKILGDSTRMNILFALEGGALCVCDIAAAVGMTKSAVSHQLKSLRQSNLVSYKKIGKNIFYSLADDHVKSIIEIALEHINH